MFEAVSLRGAVNQNRKVGKRNHVQCENNIFGFGVAEFRYYQDSSDCYQDTQVTFTRESRAQRMIRTRETDLGVTCIVL